jgi:hypothetical protein
VILDHLYIYFLRWYLGIQSKKDPAHVMNEVYKAMQALKCVWHQVNNYRVLCLWTYTSGIMPKPSQAIEYKVSDLQDISILDSF